MGQASGNKSSEIIESGTTEWRATVAAAHVAPGCIWQDLSMVDKDCCLWGMINLGRVGFMLTNTCT